MVGVSVPQRAPEPGTGWLVARGDRDSWEWDEAGTLSRAGPPVHERTLFDLASITKVLITVPLTIKAIADGLLTPETEVGSLLTWLGGSRIGEATISQLLTHTAGAPPELEIDRSLDDALIGLEVSRAGIIRYSDAGFIVLGRVLEGVTGTSLDVLAREHSSDMGADPGQVEFGPVPPDRWADTGAAPPGAVHDPTARKAGRLLGHAGCFATVAGTWALLRFWLKPGAHLSSLVSAAMTQQSNVGGARGWGWALQNDDFACAPGWSDNSVSHTGFTGTVTAIDPQAGNFAFVLSNAVADGSGASLGWLRSIMTNLAPSQAGFITGSTV